jgi:hypothetical protein
MYSQSRELDFRIKSILEKIKGLLENVPELDVIGAKDIALRQHFHWMGWRSGTNDWFEQGYSKLSTDVEEVLGDALRDLNPMSVLLVQTHKRTTNANLVIKWNDELAESRDDEYQLVDRAIEIVQRRT